MTLEELEKDFNDFRAKVKAEFGEMRKEFDQLTPRVSKIEKEIETKPKEEKKSDDSKWF